MRYAVALVALLLSAGPLAAQAIPIVGGPVEPNVAMYTARDLGSEDAPMQAVSELFRASADGTTASPMPTSECLPPCLALAERVAREGNQLRVIPPDWPRLGWIVAVTKGGVRVEVGETFVGRGNTMVGVLPGEYAVSFWLGPNNVVTRQNRIPVANEVTVPNFSARRAGRSAAARLAVAPPPSGAATAAARSVADTPITGWRMVREEPEPEPEADPIAAAPAEPVLDEPETPPAPPIASTPEPVAEAEPEATEPAPATDRGTPIPPAPAATCTVAAAELLPTVNRLEQEGDYGGAQACLLRLARQDRGRTDLRQRLARLGELKLALDLLTAEERAELATRRRAVTAAAEAGQTERLLEAAAGVLALVPGDIATMSRLEGGFSLTERPGNGPQLGFTFVPGASADPTRSALLANRRDVPELGFLLTTGEVTNRQFAHFLNQIPAVSDELYVVEDRDRRGIVLTRSGLWEPARAAATLPAVDATWHGAKAYAEWVGGRLPTEAEWTWALEGGGEVEGRDANLLREGSGQPVAAGTLAADDLGLYHMVGNVWEWLGRAETGSDDTAPIAGGSFSTFRSVIDTQPINQTRVLETDGQVGFRVLKPLGE